MDPINPWIDPNETRRMAERLMLPAREPVQAPENTGFDDSFVGFSDSPPEETAAAVHEPDRVEAAADPVSSARKSSELHAPPEYSGHLTMLRDQFGAISIFMIDPQGELVFSEGEYGAFRFIARDLVKSAAPPNHLRLKVGANAVLEIIPIESDAGLAWLGVVLPGLLPLGSDGQIRLHWLGVQ